MEFLGRKFPLPFAKSQEFSCYFMVLHFRQFGLREMISLSVILGGINRNCKALFGKSLLDYARIAWEKALKDSKKESTYDGVFAKF